ncbi:hypothetical protein ACFHW2_02705 [Actinomadura sp. LOL_016]|uniref:hypothetical protein n=1 Tax=unclassified Actinomadura TaxID=2626254 RepID=UPI003A7FA39C
MRARERWTSWRSFSRTAMRRPDVRERAAALCRTAAGGALGTLWDSDTGPGTPLRDALLDNPAPPAVRALDPLWDELIDALSLGDRPLRVIAARTILRFRDGDLVEEICAHALDRPETARFCAEHGLAPADPPRRAVFFLLTGRPEQYRALDPDGSLLALAYAAAPKPERARLREAMAEAGDLGLVGVIAGGDRRTRLADVSDAVRVGPTRAGPEPAKVGPQARFRFRGQIGDLSFSPDGRFLAVASTGGGAGAGVAVLDLATGRLAERHDGSARPSGTCCTSGTAP